MDLEIIKKCKEDISFFVENFIYIQSEFSIKKCKLFDYQKRYLEFINSSQYGIAPKWRCGGFSTMNCCWALWKAMFFCDQNIMIITGRDSAARALNFTLQMMIERLPNELREFVGKANKHTIKFESGSSIETMTFTAACGKKINCLIVEDAAYIKDMEMHWKAMYPCIAHPTGKCIITSTQKKTGSWFNESLTYANEGKNSFKVFDSSYLEHPVYGNPEWTEQVKANLGEKLFRLEILCQPED